MAKDTHNHLEIIDNLLEECIAIELNVGNLYLFFYNNIPHSGDFWWQLSIEEGNHAALLKGYLGKIREKDFLSKIFFSEMEELKKTNTYIKKLYKKYQEKIPSLEEACKTALKLEGMVGEQHYQTLVTISSESPLIQIMQKLNSSDKNHMDRIAEYMKGHGIE
ncbi:MAG: rubrerythrin family protein [Nitrospirae bacterium]|nr:rubrerythrin family protein [Nitrospirota bacterium]